MSRETWTAESVGLLAQTFVRDFEVSTANRTSSAIEMRDYIYAETIVWTRARERIVFQGECCRGSLRTHFEIVQRIFDTGSPDKALEDET
jgi:hypothetical protein